ncbi:MAG TPA: hypothetical protein VFV03_07455 [Solirubrobacteraceae bacterium]|nr:hypothetical protein [Solirubrobacteraceae bacterium]
MRGPGEITIQARSYEWLATSTTKLRFPAPLSHRSSQPEGFEFWWKMLEFVFALPAPDAFPPLSNAPSKADREILDRFIHTAEEMAESSLLSGRNEMTVNIGEGGVQESVETEFVTNEITRGFATLFRQMHSTEKSDPARFVRVHEILKQTNERAKDDRVSERARQLDAWKKARASLLQENLKVRVGQKLRAEGRMPAGIPGEGGMSPQTLISAYQYGDLIHWGHHRDKLEAVADDPFQDAHQRMQFLDAAAGLSHLYMGFSLLVRAALGTS